MYLLGLGCLLLVLKLVAFGPVAVWSWWWIALPFALAVMWWSWADRSGYTKRKAMEREARRGDARRERTKNALKGIHR